MNCAKYKFIPGNEDSEIGYTNSVLKVINKKIGKMNVKVVQFEETSTLTGTVRLRFNVG